MGKSWNWALEELRPFIFKVDTFDRRATGFQILYSHDQEFCGIATAYHIIADAKEQKQPIVITHPLSSKSVVLKESDRIIVTDPGHDLAFIRFNASLLPVEQREPLRIRPPRTLKQGVEIAWCGFPNIAPPNELCFFAGHTSYYDEREAYYLVDGVVMSGVSGGPAFYIEETAEREEVVVAGVVSAYRVNREDGEVYPGLSKICSIDPYQDMLKDLRSWDEASKKTQ